MIQGAAALAEAILAGDRTALARGITLVESTRPDHRQQALDLLDRLMGETGGSRRVGVSGPPGVGKSTLVEALGLHIVTDHRLAVLAVDPSSPRSGGSVLGDKTRMERLSRTDTFIRPSPSGRTTGGIARRTGEALLLCEAAGFDVVLVETVGAGQSDVAVADLVDVFVLLVQPSSGDELQGIKRGVMELADVVVVTKADGELAPAAQRSVADHRAALGLLRDRTPPVLACSAAEGTGIAEVWEAITEVQADEVAGDRRARQARRWLWSAVEDRLMERMLADEAVQALTPEVEAAVAAGSMAPAAGAARLLEALR